METRYEQQDQKPPGRLVMTIKTTLRVIMNTLIPPDRSLTLKDGLPELPEEDLHLSKNAQSFSSDLFAELLLELPAQRRVMKESYARDDYNGLRNSVHQLLGAAAYCDATELEISLRELRLALKTGERETIDLYYSRAINVINSTLRYSGYRAG
jgi:HPt (histidine-containing phosphotransfer) domain-containing protein